MDILEFAINMEMDGENYYNKLADASQQHSLKTVFFMLAEDEKNHARILRNNTKGIPFVLNNTSVSPNSSVFSGMDDFKIEIQKTPDQVNLYRLALEKEKQSIDLYQKLLSEATDNREVFEYLVKQEEEHYKIVEEIMKMVGRPNSWVESSEFGIREEY